MADDLSREAIAGVARVGRCRHSAAYLAQLRLASRPAAKLTVPISERLAVPSNITIVPLPAKCPELNPVENVWQFMRDNWLSNRVFQSYDAIVDHCCYAWNQFVDRPWRVMSIGLRDWAMGHTQWNWVLHGR